MSVTSVAVAVPEGLGQRAAIEWTVNHLIRLLDIMDAKDDVERERLPVKAVLVHQRARPSMIDDRGQVISGDLDAY